MVKLVSSQKHITGNNVIVNANGLAQEFTAVDTSSSDSSSSSSSSSSSNSTAGQNNSANTGQMGGREGFVGGGPGGGNFVLPDVTVTGVSTSKLTDVFTNGDAKLLSGRAITPQDADKKVALIEKNLADQNNLKVGSKIKIKATRADDTVEYTVIGIYEAAAASSSTGEGMRNMTFTEPYNRIFVDYKSAIPLKNVSSDSGVETGGIDQAVFYVDDPQNIDLVKNEVKSLKIDWNQFTLDANDLAYQQMMGPIENVASFSKTVVYLVAVAGSVILALVLMLSIKERMYETGVFLSMGEGKMKIIAQYVAEVLLIAMLAFGMSIYTGRFVAQGVGNTLLEREIQLNHSQSASGQGGGYAGQSRGFGQGGGFGGGFGRMFGQQSPQDYQAIDKMNIQVTVSEVEQMSLAGLLILVAGTMLPAATVMRYKPKTILTKA
jgi:putative ABC transport system permease protein